MSVFVRMKFCQNGQHVEPTTNVANVLPRTTCGHRDVANVDRERANVYRERRERFRYHMC